ncbi:MAG: acyltransferase [Deltaproteobacteria bacterium]|nr:acyltransferase [Deltaproteobacteria bacterium]
MSLDPFRVNNLDLLRLFAATQVAVLHGAHHLGLGTGEAWWVQLLGWFPGVPIFFFVSGLLISRSYEHNPVLREYALNRGLRIYPALWTNVALSFLAVIATGYLASVSAAQVAIWAAAQATFLPFYNPEFMRGFGVGVLNGSLWTIAVELQFYAFIPLLYLFLRPLERLRVGTNTALLSMVLVFLVINRVYFHLLPTYGDMVQFKLLGVSLIPWLYMFLLGVLAQRHLRQLLPWVQGRLLVALPAYLALAWAGTSLGLNSGNGVHPVLYLPLIFTVLAFTYTLPHLGERLLRRNDISYGVYIYHMPVVNLLLYYGVSGNIASLALALVLSFLLAGLSWRLVERPAMRAKRHALHPVPAGAPAP